MVAPRPVESPTVRAHKRQLAWQILVPFLMVTALIIVVAVLVAIGAATTNRTWADVSTIWLIAPMLVFALLFVAVLGFLIYGIARLLQVTPRYTGKAQDFFALLSDWDAYHRRRSRQAFCLVPAGWSHPQIHIQTIRAALLDARGQGNIHPGTLLPSICGKDRNHGRNTMIVKNPNPTIPGKSRRW